MQSFKEEEEDISSSLNTPVFPLNSLLFHRFSLLFLPSFLSGGFFCCCSFFVLMCVVSSFFLPFFRFFFFAFLIILATTQQEKETIKKI